MMRNSLLVLFIVVLFSCEKKVAPPDPFGPLPSPAQVSWQQMEMNMFIHFNMNTFTNMEWGTGGESPELFEPTDLDTRQWVDIAKQAGMKGIILTAKHHDGFCLWPSKYTEHSVKNSPWENGEGDVIGELAEACKEAGLKLGLYLSPWDRNHADYGKPEYIDYYRNQLIELFENYGPLFEFWVDGANGGTGYYGGANEERRIDRLSYYDWDSTFSLVFDQNPDAIIFSDAGPGCRWVGNEQGWAKETNWSLLNTEKMAPGVAKSEVLQTGVPDGTQWVPAEADVSIRPGWYYHPEQDSLVKTMEQLEDIYYNSVGRNALLLLNFPVDTTGQIHPIDSARILELTEKLSQDFSNNLSANAHWEASEIRGNDNEYDPVHLSDESLETFWTVENGTMEGIVTQRFDTTIEFNRVVLQEPIQMGQRISGFVLEYLEDENWVEFAKQTTIGYKRILRVPSISTTAVRIRITDTKAEPLLSTFQLYNASNN